MPIKTANLPELGEIKLSKRKGTRHLRLRINQKGEVVVSMPTWVPYRAGLEFAKSQSDWIIANTHKKVAFTDQQKIGKLHRLRFLRSKNSEIRTRIVGSDAVVYLPDTIVHTSEEAQHAAKRVARRALEAEAYILEDRLSELAKEFGYTYTDFRAKFMSSKWGSRRSDGRITLNLRLLDLSDESIDYVIIHELAHTKVMNHSKEYWTVVESMMHDYKVHRKNLKNVSLPWSH
jgi:predicted metal-dependent hydrolase